MVRRNRRTMKLDVLNVILKGSHNPTPIMYKANLSWKTLQEIFESLLKSNLIKLTRKYGRSSGIREYARYFSLTEKGREVIELNFHVNARLGDN